MTRTMMIVIVVGLTAACGIEPDPPPEVPQSAYGGMGDIMAKCMQYASESQCYKSTWGGRTN